jgi:putative PEP-CTERM system TPR-repeat lipoprotein
MMRIRLLGTSLFAASLAVGLCGGIAPPDAHAESYLQEGRAALARGDLQTAQIQLRNAVRAHPRDGEARFLLAEVQLQLGNPVAAEQQAKAAAAHGYQDSAVIPVLAAAMLAQNHGRELLQQLTPNRTDKVTNSEIEQARGAAYLALNEADKGAAALARAEQLDPANAHAWLADARLALARGQMPAAKEKLARALAADPDSVQARALKAQLMAIDKDVPGALKLLDATIASHPPAVPARLLRANLLMAGGKFAAARADDDAVLKVLPNNVEALFLRAVLLHQEGKNEAADAVLDHLQPVFPELIKGWFLQAAVKESLGQHQAAAAAARRYVAHAPDDPNGAKLLAQIEFELQRPDLAIPPLAKLVADGKADAQAYDMLGRAYAAVGVPGEAVKDFAKAASLAPNDAGVRTQLASTLLRIGRPDAAVAALQHALTIDPKQPQIGEALFLAALKTGDTDKAAAVLAEVRKAQGDTAVVQNLDGLLQLARLDLPAAKARFTAIVAQHPKFMPARINLARTLAMEGDEAGYQSTLSAILQQNPAAEPALTLLANALLAKGQGAAAIQLLDRAHEAQPKDIPLLLRLGDLYIRQKEPEKALALAHAAAPNGAPSVPLLGLQAASQIALKQTQAAQSSLSALIAAEPRALAARRELAALKVQAGDYATARDLIRAGIALAPNNYQLYLDDALIDLKQSGLETALATARALRDQDLGFAPLQALPGDVCMAANQPAEAAKHYEAAAKEHPSLLLATRIAAAMQRQGQTDQAVAMLKDWLGQHPEDIQVASLLSNLEIARKHYAEAKLYLQQVLAKAPHDAGSLNNLAWIDQKLGDTAHARELAHQAYLLEPQPQTADTLGWILTTGGDPARGVILLRQAHAGSADPRIAYHYAVALDDTGQAAAAIPVLRQAVEAKIAYGEKEKAAALLDKLTKGTTKGS